MKMWVLWLAIFIFVAMAVPIFAQYVERDSCIDPYREGKFAEALPLLERATTLNPGDRVASLFLGTSYLRTNNTKAETYISSVRALDSQKMHSGPPALWYPS